MVGRSAHTKYTLISLFIVAGYVFIFVCVRASITNLFREIYTPHNILFIDFFLLFNISYVENIWIELNGNRIRFALIYIIFDV